MGEHVLTERNGSVIRITLNRPEKRNALSLPVLRELTDAFVSAGKTDATCVVLAAEGPVFSAGHNFGDMLGADYATTYEVFDTCTRMMKVIQSIPQIVVARVHALATAAGCQLVATCDLAVAAEDARFAVSGVNLGLFCSTPSVALSRNLSRKEAFEMLVTGEFISAAEARDKGLVNRVVPAGQLDDEIARLAAQITAKPAVAIAMGKELFYRQLEMGTDAAYQLAGQTMACNMMDDAALEGVQAFIEKRKPDWS